MISRCFFKNQYLYINDSYILYVEKLDWWGGREQDNCVCIHLPGNRTCLSHYLIQWLSLWKCLLGNKFAFFTNNVTIV